MLAYLITAVVITGAAWLAWRLRTKQTRGPAPSAPVEARHDHQTQTPVAIIGISFNLPDAQTLEQLWDNLSNSRDSLRSIDVSRWSGALPDDVPGQAGLIDGIEQFDPMFFGISAAEAEVMDPQQRLMMLHIWRAIEDAGIAPGSLSGREVGIFMASAPSGYRQRLLQPGIEPQGHHATAAVGSVGPNRMSYFLNLRGPSETVETACSSSLVAIDRGVAAIRSGQCELVVCGGVNTLLDPALHISFARAGMLSPSGRCRTFSEAADGYARGEGVVVFVLKDLQQALRDRDPIYAQILGSGVSHGGRANTFTSPSPQAQSALIKSVLEQAGVAAGSVGYVEAHGTGTRLGDPIEISALKQAFSAASAEGYCALGSIKTNIGHLELAAGAAGVLKVLAQLRYRAIAPSLHSQPANPFLRLQGSPFFVPGTCQPWQPVLDEQGNPLPLRAAISSFGFGGVNAHALLEAPPLSSSAVACADLTGQPLLLPLSARTDAVLATMVSNLLAWLEGGMLNAQQLRQLAYTLQTGRDQMPRRWAAVACDQAQLVAALKAYPAQSETPASPQDGQAALLQPWLQGQTLDWQGLYAAQEQPWKLNVPGYPFELASYWLPEAPPRVAGTSLADAEAMALAPHWEVAKPEPRSGALLAQRLVVLAAAAAQARALDVCALQPACVQSTLIASDDWQQATLKLFETLRQPHTGSTQVLLLASALPNLLEGVSGLLRSLAREQGQAMQLIVVDDHLDAEQLNVCLTQELGCTEDDHVRYHAGQRWRQRWTPLEPAVVAPQTPFKAQGVYLISGGLGAIGRQLVCRLRATCPEARLILTGRSPLDSERRALLTSLDAGALVIYRMVDAGVAAQVSELLCDIRAQYGRLDGIFHCAGHLADTPASDKPAEAFRAVVHDKVVGLMLLDELSRPLAPDFIVNFASAAGVLGNAGQTDYACASALGDGYAHAAARARAQGAVRPRLLSINWPVWAQGGLQPGPDKVRLLEHLGLHGLSTQAAWNQLQVLLQTDVPQALVATHRSEQLLLMLNGQAPATALPDSAVQADELQAFLRDAVAQVTRFPLSAVTLQRPFAELGLDSIMVTALNARLEARFGPQPKTLFFEHQTLLALAEYLQRSDRAPVPPPVPVASLARPGPAVPAADCDGIAIIGVAGRYPGAASLDAWWDLLAEGRSAISEVPPGRWPLAGFFEPDVEVAVASGYSYGKWGGFIDGVCDFDAPFFALSPKDARLMDPQERLFLQTAWEALEDAGYTREWMRLSCQNHVGVYAGITKTGYELNRPAAGVAGPGADPISSFSSAANRVSYFFDFNGPSHAVDTMCSSSLTAIHQACEDLHRGHCTLALAGGVNLYLHPQTYVRLCARRMLSSDGLCKSFGLGGNGFVPGEGVGVIVLKRLTEALRDGDNIQGVIRATAVNHGGRTNGYTVPNPAAQAAVIKAALSRAGVAPQELGYIEAHGTGTELGDPIEMRGIAKAFDELGARSTSLVPCVVGSVKSNIGHLEAAAGIAGVTKVLLQFKHAKIVPSLHSSVPNPAIDFAQGTLQVPQTLLDWPRGTRRLAGISGFGAGGANAHVLIEAYEPPALRHKVEYLPQIFVLSARSQPQLLAAASRLLAAIQGLQVRSSELDRLAYTLQTGREAFSWRLAVVESDIGRLAQALAGFIAQAANAGGIYSGQASGAAPLLSEASPDDLAQAWVQGAMVDWHARWPLAARPVPISLPTYPFALKRLWIDDGNAPQAPATPVVAVPSAQGLVLEDSSTASETRYSLQLESLQRQELDMVPLALYVELALSVSARQPAVARPLCLQRLDAVAGPVAAGGQLHAALFAPSDTGQAGGIEMYDEHEVVLCQVFLDQAQPRSRSLSDSPSAGQHMATTELYARLAQQGMRHGPEQRYINDLHWDGQGRLDIQLAAQCAPLFAQYHLAPVCLAALVQALEALGLQSSPVLSHFDSLVVFKPAEVVRTLRLQVEAADCTVALSLFDPAGERVAQFEGLQIESPTSLWDLLGSVPVEQPRASGKWRLLALNAPWPVRRARPAKITLAPTLAAAPVLTQPRHSVLRDADVLDDLKSAFGTSLMIPTLNRTGFMLEELTEYSQAFADYAGTCEGEVLDLGCAFGVASIAALENGARVLAVDMEKTHLDILQERVTPVAAQRLRTQVGVLPDLDFAPESFDAIHAGRVLHFLRPQEVRLVLARMFEWLRPGGKIIVTSDSPFFGYWASNADDYLRRKAAGDPWPAYIEDVTRVFDAKAVAGAPSCINPMDPEVLQRECQRLGYQVERVGFFNAGALSRMHDNQSHAGKEHAGVIARKPESVVGTSEYRDGLVRQQLHCPGLGQLDYYSRGQGDTALIFIHGLGCDHAFWSEQVLQFAGSYRVITLDLPMHGTNQQGQHAFSIASCARLVVELVQALKLEQCILLGHSLGGPIAVSAAALMPTRVRALVAVETLHDLSAHGREAIGRTLLIDAARKEALLDSMLPISDSKGIRQRVLHARMKVPAAVIEQGDREMVAYVRDLAQGMQCPALLVNASGWMPTDVAAAQAAGFEVLMIESSEHYLMLDKPYRLNRVIEEFLATV